MSEENTISEEDLEGLLEEAKGEEPVVETEPEKKEAEEQEVGIELEEPESEKKVEPEKEPEKEEGIELEVEEEPEQKKVREPEDSTRETEQPQQSSEVIQPVTQTGLVAPVCSVQESVRIFKEFEKAKREILISKDVLWIGSDGRPAPDGEGTPHIKRSGWRKLARFFGLSWDIENIEKLTMGHGYMYKVRVKVWHPAGASVISEGVATSKDVFFTKAGRKEASEENVLMKAQTVAVNRAISDILGGGEVSGEETE